MTKEEFMKHAENFGKRCRFWDNESVRRRKGILSGIRVDDEGVCCFWSIHGWFGNYEVIEPKPLTLEDYNMEPLMLDDRKVNPYTANKDGILIHYSSTIISWETLAEKGTKWCKDGEWKGMSK